VKKLAFEVAVLIDCGSSTSRALKLKEFCDFMEGELLSEHSTMCEASLLVLACAAAASRADVGDHGDFCVVPS
jgi:dihydroxyacetone kinase DhaKLM complex PTS-EIIA-like component DhaM